VRKLVFPPPRNADTASELGGREQSVLLLLAWGYTNKEAAARLGLSVKTVDSYRARLGHKLGFRSRVDMVAWAAQHGWLDQRP
jgi:DNA-binding NarL/FixJ family response regulator